MHSTGNVGQQREMLRYLVGRCFSRVAVFEANVGDFISRFVRGEGDISFQSFYDVPYMLPYNVTPFGDSRERQHTSQRRLLDLNTTIPLKHQFLIYIRQKYIGRVVWRLSKFVPYKFANLERGCACSQKSIDRSRFSKSPNETRYDKKAEIKVIELLKIQRFYFELL